MKRIDILKNESVIKSNIITYYKDKFNDNMEDLKICKAKIYKKIALIEYSGATFAGSKMINLNNFKVIECKIFNALNIDIQQADGTTRKGAIKRFTDSYNNTLKLLIKCKKSNKDIKVYSFI